VRRHEEAAKINGNGLLTILLSFSRPFSAVPFNLLFLFSGTDAAHVA